MADLDYSNIVNPYDVNLTRTGDTLSIGTPMTGNIPYGASNTDASITPTALGTSSTTNDTSIGTNNTGNGSVEVQPVKSDGGMGDLWITNFIRSQNWKPKSIGFYIDGQTGYAEFTNVYVSGNIQALTGLIGGFTIGATDLSASSGGNTTTLSSGLTAFSAGPTGSPTFTVTQAGLVTATAGTIGGWVLGSTTITDLSTKTGLSSAVTGGDDIRFWAGNTNPGLAPFLVTESGALVASSATITGSITATTGSIGSWVIGTTTITGTGVTLSNGLADAYISFGVTPPAIATVGTGIFINKTGLYGLNSNVQNFKIDATNGYITAIAGTVGGCTLASTSIGSSTFVSGPLGSGWNISNTGTAEFQNVTVRGSIRTTVFEKDTISAVNGIVLVSSADILTSDMTALDSSTLTISGQTTFSNNEVLRIKDGTDDEWMLVTNASGAPTYVVTRDTASTYPPNGNPIWKKGTAVVSMGVGTGSKTGYVLLDSSSTYSPYIDVYGRNSNTYNDTTLHARLGWLKGITDSDVGLATNDVWGLYTDNAYIKGVIVAKTGYIGGTTGWVISSNYIKDVAGVTGMSSVVTAGDDIRFWAGHVTPSSAPFQVTEAGALIATSATITGAITATTGSIGGWVVTANYIKDIAGVVGLSSVVTAGDDIRFWAGHATPSSAPFQVTEAGVLTASSATITGAINATSGKIGSATNYWNITSNGITAVAGGANVYINYGKTGFDNTQSGFILGYDYAASLAKFFVGNSTNYFNWDGSNISIAGNITMGTTNYVKGGQTAFKTGDGVFLGYDSTNELDQYNYNSGASSDLTFADGTTSAVGQSTNVTAGILNIKEVRFFLKKVSSNTATIFCDLYAMGTDFNPTGASLGQTSIAGITNSTFSEYSFSFSSPIAVSQNQRYCAVLTSPGTATGIVARGWLFTGGDLGNTSYYSGAWHYVGGVLDYKVYSTSTGYKFSVGNSGYQFSYNTQNVSLTSSLIIRNSYNPASQPSSPYASYGAGGFVYYNNGWTLRQNTSTGDNFNIMTNSTSGLRTGNSFNSFYNLDGFDSVTSAGFKLSTGMGDSMYFYKDASGNVRLDASNYLIIGAGGYSVPFTTSYVEIGSAYRKATIHASSLAACPLPSTDNALDQMSLVPPHKDKSQLKDPDKAHYEHIDKGKANRKYFDIDDVPDDITFITREGDKDIDIIRTVGFLFKAVQELNDEIKTLKKKIK